jgi:SAM-dependent methyltransferase
MAEFPWDPAAYLELVRREVPDYEALQDALVDASRHAEVRAILELGVGSGETTRRLLDAHPSARVVGVDSSADMLRAAREALPATRVSLQETGSRFRCRLAGRLGAGRASPRRPGQGPSVQAHRGGVDRAGASSSRTSSCRRIPPMR